MKNHNQAQLGERGPQAQILCYLKEAKRHSEPTVKSEMKGVLPRFW